MILQSMPLTSDLAVNDSANAVHQVQRNQETLIIVTERILFFFYFIYFKILGSLLLLHKSTSTLTLIISPK